MRVLRLIALVVAIAMLTPAGSGATSPSVGGVPGFTLERYGPDGGTVWQGHIPNLEVLDPRLRTKGYGRRFLASLPPAPVVHDLLHIETFFSD